MQAGRELDIEVARKVFRYVVMIEPSGVATIWNLAQRAMVPVPHYSTRVEDAHLVMQHFQNHGWRCELASNTNNGPVEWSASLSRNGSGLTARASSMAHAMATVAIGASDALNRGD
jgi:hypothetical protein